LAASVKSTFEDHNAMLSARSCQALQGMDISTSDSGRLDARDFWLHESECAHGLKPDLQRMATRLNRPTRQPKMFEAGDRWLTHCEKARRLSWSINMSQSRRRKVQQAIDDIREFYQCGNAIPPHRASRQADNGRTVEEAADEWNLNPDTARKARQFIDPKDGYTPRDLTHLCSLLKRIQANQDESKAVFRRTHVIRLLTIKSSRQRRAVQRKAIEEGWGLIRLETEIAARFGTRRAGGRRPSIPDQLAPLLAVLERDCERWRRLYVALASPKQCPKPKHLLMADLPAAVHQQLKAVNERIQGLHSAVVSELQALRPSRSMRRVYR
jgi:hypothetical protein